LKATAMPLKGTGFGIASIRRRLFLLFGRHDLLQIKKEVQQFIVIISFPQIANENKNAAISKKHLIHKMNFVDYKCRIFNSAFIRVNSCN